MTKDWRLIQPLLVFLLLFISLNLFASRILITGKPGELIRHDDYYTLPESYVTRPSYRFVVLAGIQRVCYHHEVFALEKLPKLSIIIEENHEVEEINNRYLWICYRYDPTYFEIDY